jgi:hypothetical protein
MQSQNHHLGVAFVCNKLDAAFCNVLYDYFPSAVRQMKIGISFPLGIVKAEDLSLLRPGRKTKIADIQLFI